jgi:NitT/TauT family transport system substrate-binding protein
MKSMKKNITAMMMRLTKKNHRTKHSIKKTQIRNVVVMFMAVLVFSSVFVACKQNENQATTADNQQQYTPQDIKVAAMKGPTAIGMVSLMQKAENKTTDNNYEFTIAAAADEFTSDLVKGNIQIAALPCNVAANLYNKSNGKIRVLGINTLGVLYILDSGNSVHSVTDLKGKTIYTTGKGTTPEYTLRYLLQSAGLDPDKDVDIEFKSEATEVAAVMSQEKNGAIAMLPQPYVATVMMNNDKIQIALDVTKEWEKLAGSDSTVVTGVIAVNAEYYSKHQDAVEHFVKEYSESVAYVNEHVNESADLVEHFGIFKAAVAQTAIPYCNITWIDKAQMKTKIQAYLNVLYQQNSASIGDAMPSDSFYIQ